MTPSCLNGLADRLGNFIRLSGRETDPSLSVANGDKSIEREAATTLHNFRDAVDRDNVFDEIAAFTLSTATAVTSTARSTTAARAAAVLTAALTAASTA
jgi:hypothetical protein